MANWQIKNSNYIVNDRWLKLRADSCVTPDGHTIEPYYVFEYKNWVNCLVLDEDLNVIMLRHYRHGVQQEILEIIGGGIEDSDASPMEAIQRELKEELGYTGGEIFETGVTYPNPASQTNKVYSFLAVGGKRTTEQELEKGENLRMKEFEFRDIINKLENPDSGEIFQSMHATSIFFALNFIRKSSSELLAPIKAIIG